MLFLFGFKSRFSVPVYRLYHQISRCLSQNGNKEYLASLGYSAGEIEGVLKAFPSGIYTPVSELKMLGPMGLNSLIEAVRREIVSKNQRPRSPVVVSIKFPGKASGLKIQALEGDTFYDLVQNHHELNRYLECACKGIAACSTCHVIVDQSFASRLPEPEESEADMIDLAWGVTETSRLGCQIHIMKELDGMVVTIPEQSNNLFGK